MTPAGQVAYFRIRPHRSGLYYTVRVFRTAVELREYAKANRASGVTRGQFQGLATSWWVTRVRKRRPDRLTAHAGEMLLAQDFCGSEVVSHECAHLALGWARRKRVSLTGAMRAGRVDAAEEQFCYALGQLVRATYIQLYRRKVIT